MKKGENLGVVILLDSIVPSMPQDIA